MKKLKSKRFSAFNMVEVVIALGILVIGLTGILGLLPAGMKATQEAVYDNDASNIATAVLRSIQSRIAAENCANWDPTADDGTGQPIGDRAGFFNEINEYRNEVESFVNLIPDNFSPTPIPGTTIHTLRPGVIPAQTKLVAYLFKQEYANPGGGAAISESAIVQVWRPTDLGDWVVNGYTIDDSDGKGALKSFSATLMLEISYPAELPYDARRKSYFRLDLFNPNII